MRRMGSVCQVHNSPNFAARALPSPGGAPIVAPVGAWRSPVSALVWGTRGRGFESRRSDH
jgi:hypothetical protein